MSFHALINNSNPTEHSTSSYRKENTNNNYSSVIRLNTNTEIITPMKSKNLSPRIREIDYNTYRAYKIPKENKNQNTKTKDNFNVFSSSFTPKASSFDLKAQAPRSKCQDEIVSNRTQWQGHLKRYTEKQNCTWKDLIGRTALQSKQRCIGDSKAYNYSILANINSKRTIEPQRDWTPNDTVKKRRQIKKCLSVGSIANWLNVTPLNRAVRVRDKITRCHGIFGEEYNNDTTFRKQKTPVNINNIKRTRDYAGSYKVEESADLFMWRSSNDVRNNLNNNNNTIKNSSFKDEYDRSLYSTTNTISTSYIPRIKRNCSNNYLGNKGGNNGNYSEYSRTIESNISNRSGAFMKERIQLNKLNVDPARKSENNTIYSSHMKPGKREWFYDYNSCHHQKW